MLNYIGFFSSRSTQLAVLIAVIGISPSLFSQEQGRLRTLDRKISSVVLRTGSEAIGGASIEDAVLFLRRVAGFPVCFESRELTRQTDGLSLGEAIQELRELKEQGEMTPQDADRLAAYEQMIATQNASTVILFRETTFRFSAQHISIRSFLDRIVQLDKLYVWYNYGSSEKPLIVIQPRTSSVLEFAVPVLCGDTMTGPLYGPSGRLTNVFSARGITLVEATFTGSVPNVPIDICRPGLKARDVLNQSVAASGASEAWTVSGIRGFRVLTFAP